MNISTKFAMLFATILVGGYFAWIHLGQGNERSEKSNTAPSGGGNHSFSPLPKVAGSGVAPTSNQRQFAHVDGSPMPTWAKWSTSDNLKMLYDERRNTVSGDPAAAFYLYNILRECIFITSGGHEKSRERTLRGKFSPDIEAARLAAFEGIWRKCAGFENMPMNKANEEQDELAAIGERNGSIQFAARKIALSNREKDPNFDAKVFALLETGDTTVLFELSRFAATSAELSRLGGDKIAASQNALLQAWQMAVCDAGYDCQNLLLPNFCMENGVCTAIDYADGVRLTALSPVEYEIANQLRFKIGNAIRSKEWATLGFRRPK